MKIENTVEVDAPLDRVWALVNDIPRVAPCMPGAALTGVLDDDTYEGTVAVKLGPLRMSYKGKVTVEEVDEANHSARLAASGKDTKGAGTARASVETRLEAASDTRTRLHVTSDVQLTGKVASFGRGGAINDVATRLFGQFADCLRATLEAESAEPRRTDGSTAAGTAAEPRPAATAAGRRRPAAATAASSPARPPRRPRPPNGGGAGGAVGDPARPATGAPSALGPDQGPPPRPSPTAACSPRPPARRPPMSDAQRDPPRLARGRLEPDPGPPPRRRGPGRRQPGRHRDQGPPRR